MASTNLTGTVVLCYAPWEASSKLPATMFSDAFTGIEKSGALGLIFAQHNSNIPENLNRCDGIMPCVLVDFEMAHRIASYATTAE